MACPQVTLKGLIHEGCGNIAGIKKAWLGVRSEFTIVPDYEDMSCTITAIGNAKIYEYQFPRETGSITSTMTKNVDNNNYYYTTDVVLQFNRLSAEKHLEVQALAAGQLFGIFLDGNDEYHVVGIDSYLTATDQTAETGTSFDDANHYSTTLQERSGHLPCFTTKSVVEGLVG